MSARDVIERALRAYYADSRDPKGVVAKLLAMHDSDRAHGLAEKIRDAVQGDDPDYAGTRGASWAADLIDPEVSS